MPTIVDSRSRRIAMARNGEIVIVDAEGRERATFRIPYGAMLQFESGHIISKGERMAEWDPYTLPIITESAGTIKYQDLIEGQSLEEQVEDRKSVVTEKRRPN